MKTEMLQVDEVQLDMNNPRIARILEMYGEVTAENVSLALGVGDTAEGENYASFYSLKESIRVNGGVIHPIIVNRESKDRLVVIEGNTRLQIYRDFSKEGVLGSWKRIPAVVHENLDGRSIDAIRLQAHLVGPRPWEPYSKAKYLTHLRNGKNLTLDQIVEFCGGRRKQVLDYVAAFHDMEKHYRPRVVADGATFDATRFSAFVELQRPRVFNALATGGLTKDDFAQWVLDELLMPLNTVRQLPRILGDEKAKEIFLAEGAVEAIKSLDVGPADATLADASLSQLARELARRIAKLELRDIQRLKKDPEGEDVDVLQETRSQLEELFGFISEDSDA